ncbi:RDD family protein [Wolbachia endosymbiont (group B) of Philonthus cognatus]|uniref:RDD family protein n=1 Tax=Wolbachia endosymbiont (group B) of Philonthus cognatus TaxID=2954047 RepID=UPI00221ECA4F|nr:RDD family protein [Wolbachia endosymbiont (group B) of Philonthus cognatus]
MDVKANYAEITKRIAAYLVDQTIFLVCCSFFFLLISFILPEESLTGFFNYVFSDTDTDTGLISERHEILGDLGTLLDSLVYISLEVLMIIRLGWTPGKLLFGIYIKDINTLKNSTLMQVVIRSTLKTLLFLPVYYISEWFLILPILILIPAIFDKHKQFFHDKIANTVVIDHKPEECHLNLNYVGITRRVVAHIIDGLTIMGTSLICLIFVGVIFHIAGFKLFITRSCLSFLLSIVFGVFMIRRFGGTTGQLLCGIHIKDANTLENVTLVQAIIRHTPFAVIRFPILITRREIFNKYTSEWWLDPLSGLILITIILIFICGIFDRRKQFLHDKIAKTVAVKKSRSNSDK